MNLPWEPLVEPPPPVLILGMHNSGTTMLADILHRSGLFLGNNAAHNESHFFSLFINDRLLLGGGDAWARLPFPSVEQVLARRDDVGPLVLDYWRIDYLQYGYDGSGPWGIKDPRLCILLPLYLELFPRARLLLIRRDPEDVAASLAHRYKPGVGLRNDREHWLRLTLAHLERVEQFGGSHPYYHQVEYERLCGDPRAVAPGIFEFVGLPYDEAADTRVRTTVKTDRIGTRHWPESRWRREARIRRWKQLFGPLYYALTGRG